MGEPLFDLRATVVNGIRQDCDVGVWDNAFEQAEQQGSGVGDASEHFAHGADWAARWISGLMGMAVAIKKRHGYQEWIRITTVDARPITFDDDADVDIDYEPFI